MPQLPSPSLAEFAAGPGSGPDVQFRRTIPEQSPVSLEGGIDALAKGVQSVAHADAASIAASSIARLRVAAESALRDPGPAAGTPAPGSYDADPLNAAAFTSGISGAKAPITSPGGPTSPQQGYTATRYVSFQNAVDQELAGLNGKPLSDGTVRGTLGNFLGSHEMARQMISEAAEKIGGDLFTRLRGQEAQANVQTRAASAIDSGNVAATAVQLNPDTWQAAGAEQLRAVQQLGLDPETTVKIAREINQTISTAAGRGYAKLDPEGTLSRLDDPADPLFAKMSPDARNQVQNFATGELAKQSGDSIVNSFRDQGPQVGAQAYTALEEQSGLTDEQKDLVREHVRQGLALLNEQRRTQYADQITALETGVASGSPPADAKARADALYHAYALNQTQYGAMLSSIVRAQHKDDAGAELLTDGANAFNNRTPLDPKDAHDAGAANAVFGALIGKTQAGWPAYTNAAVAVAEHTGVIPKDAVSWGRSVLLSGKPEDAVNAANMFARLQEANPNSYGFAVDESDKVTKAMVSTINDAVRAGTAPQVAVDLARQNARLSDAAAEALKAKWIATEPAKMQVPALSEILKADPAFKTGWFQSVPTPPPLMQGQFDQLTQDYFKQTNGNLQQSRALALQDLKRTWGISEVNGSKQLMQYAPEQMFPGLTAQVVREDVAKTVAENAQAFQRLDPATGTLIGAKPDATQVRLIPTEQTARSNGLEWQLGAPDQFGALDVLRDKSGNPLRYHLPVTANDYAAVKAREAQADLARARVQQQVQRDAEAGRLQAVDQGQM